MSGNGTVSNGGIGIFGLMFIALFVGKIFEIGQVGTWSWWLITAPLWGFPVALFLVTATLVVFAFLFGLTAKLFGSK